MGQKDKIGGSKGNYVCYKHSYSRKAGGLCPICREPLTSIGTRWRMGHCGQFTKQEAKTRKFEGQKRPVSWRTRNRNMKKYVERIKSCRLKVPNIATDVPEKFRSAAFV